MTSAVDRSVAAADEWLTIVETQQRELQELRAQVSQSPERWNDADARSAPSPARSSTSSSSRSSRFSDSESMPLDLERYAKVCGDLEATRHRLTLKDAKLRELRARANQMKCELEENREKLKESNERVDALMIALTAEQVATQEAVSRAAEAMVQSDELVSRLRDMACDAETARSELRLHNETMLELEARHGHMKQELTRTRETNGRLEAALQRSRGENDALLRMLEAEREERSRHECTSDTEPKLLERLEEQERILTLQTAQLEKQQNVILELHAATAALEEQLLTERNDNQRSVAQQLHVNISLQHMIDEYVVEKRSLHVALAESEERVRMQDEEITAYAAWKRSAQQRASHRDTVLNETHEIKEKMERAIRCGEASRRKAILELAETKRQFGQLQTAMAGVNDELQRMNKTFGVFRTREANVSRTLREYSRRNRVLFDAVRLMSAKVLQLSQSLQRSEKRKHQVVVQSHELQRGLVVERCQREDLLQQCTELETCLSACQRAATASAERAQSVERENAVLQHAVQQLCAYSREITASQETLQRELTRLEVEGRVEVQVFG